VTVLAAVAVFSLSVGGVLGNLVAFLLFGFTMGALVFLVALLGATAGEPLTRQLRLTGRRVQPVAALLIVGAGVALIYDGATHFFDRFVFGLH
jgi:hypothetical protein